MFASSPIRARTTQSVVKKPNIAIVVSGYYQTIADSLFEGAMGVLLSRGITESDVRVVSCPGAFEVPLAAQELAKTGIYDAVICLGCVIKGETYHFEVIAEAVTQAIMRVGLETSIPVSFGVLTPDTYMQAAERASVRSGNKGGEAALAALEMIDQLAKLRAAQ